MKCKKRLGFDLSILHLLFFKHKQEPPHSTVSLQFNFLNFIDDSKIVNNIQPMKLGGIAHVEAVLDIN